MKYEDVRAKIKSGDLIALTHKEWGSWYDFQIQVVRAVTQSEYAHAAMAIVFGGRVWVVEAVVPHVRLVPLSKMAKEGFYWVPMETEVTEKELEFALSIVGVGEYSKFQAVMGQLDELDVGEDNYWQCAEFVIACRRLSGVDLGKKATPSAVVQTALELGFPVHYVIDK